MQLNESVACNLSPSERPTQRAWLNTPTTATSRPYKLNSSTPTQPTVALKMMSYCYSPIPNSVVFQRERQVGSERCKVGKIPRINSGLRDLGSRKITKKFNKNCKNAGIIPILWFFFYTKSHERLRFASTRRTFSEHKLPWELSNWIWKSQRFTECASWCWKYFSNINFRLKAADWLWRASSTQAIEKFKAADR